MQWWGPFSEARSIIFILACDSRAGFWSNTVHVNECQLSFAALDQAYFFCLTITSFIVSCKDTIIQYTYSTTKLVGLPPGLDRQAEYGVSQVPWRGNWHWLTLRLAWPTRVIFYVIYNVSYTYSTIRPQTWHQAVILAWIDRVLRLIVIWWQIIKSHVTQFN